MLMSIEEHKITAILIVTLTENRSQPLFTQT